MQDNIEIIYTEGEFPRSLDGFHSSAQEPGSRSPISTSLCPPDVQNPTQSLEDRSDSGINSGSDGHPSSPGSEDGVEGLSSSTDQCNQPLKLTHHVTPIFQRASRPHSNVTSSEDYPRRSSTSLPVDIKLDSDNNEEMDGDSTPTFPISPTESTNMDVLKFLELSVERNLNMSASSPAISENSMGDERRSNASFDEYERASRINNHGKTKTFQCKQCSHIASTKLEIWKHRRMNHFNPEKHFTCHLCPFITEYKHHFDLHHRNHEGSKPFKCEHCDYSCVNKSMLNSHKKSHSNIYQYICADCQYVSKYCHPFKLHLRKYNHQPGMVLNSDGSPNPIPIIDVYGTRRGPRSQPRHKREQEGVEKPRSKKPRTDISAPATVLPLPVNFMTQVPTANVSLEYLFQRAMFYENLSRLASQGLFSTTQVDGQEAIENSPSEALDLSIRNTFREKNPRHLALKLDTPSTSSDDEEYKSTMMSKYVETVLTEKQNNGELERRPYSKYVISYKNFCKHCGISFGDEGFYKMHMGYHGAQDPFACSMCGEKCRDKFSFFLHIAHTPHS